MARVSWSRAGLRTPLLALFILATALVLAPRGASADLPAQPIPFGQAWTNAGLITANDDWSGVPGVTGYLGDIDGGSPTAVDPQTVVAAAGGAVDVTANQLNPNTFATGGVAEFAITDPVVALQGSGTADAPNIVIALNTTGFQSIDVGYSLRDVDGSADNAVQPIALQYRVGGAGDYTNIAAAFVADATSGPSLAVLVTPVDVTLPAAADNAGLVELRILTTNAVGSDEWVGIDDISITGTPVGGDLAPTVTGTSPVDGATGVAAGATIQVDFSEEVAVAGDWATITCAGSDVPATISAGPAASYTLNPDADFAIGADCDVLVSAAGVTDTDGTPTAMAADFTFDFTVEAPACFAEDTPIGLIQGTGASFALGGTQTVQGVVAGDFEGSASSTFRGFYVQNSPDEDDDNPLSSDGIFVFNGNTNDNVTAGDVVQVTGTVTEFSGLKELTNPVIEDCGEAGVIAPAELELPMTAEEFERYEGMLVTFPQDLVIAEYFNYDRFGEMVLALPWLPGEDRPYTGTHLDEPGTDANERTAANLDRRITLDDGRNDQNPAVLRHPNGDPFTLTNRFRGGDTVTGTTGVLDYRFSLYRVQPTADAVYTSTNPRPTEPPAVGGNLRVVGMNTLNFFVTGDPPNDNDGTDNLCGPSNTLECRGWDSDATDEFDRQKDKLVNVILGLDPDILGLNELENSSLLPGLIEAYPEADIVQALNAATAPGTYAYIETGPIGTDAIKVGLIYKPSVVTPVGDFAVLDSSVDPRFIDTRSRPALAQTFEENATGARLTVAVNHLKSKGSACDLDGDGPFPDDPDLGDGQGNCNVTRTMAVEALVDWLAADPTASGDPDFLVIGDLNSYAMEDPIDALRAGSDDTLGTFDDFVNLVELFHGPLAYSYVFDGQFGSLDYGFASASLGAQVTGADDWHINADEPDIFDYDTSFKPIEQEALYEPLPYRSSDHDPIVLGLNLRAVCVTPPTITGTPGNDVIHGTPGDDVIWALGGSDQVFGHGGNDMVCAGSGNDSVVTGAGYDTVHTGNGNDAVATGGADDFIDTGDGNDTVDAGDGANRIATGDGNDEVTADDGDDAITTGGGHDRIDAGAGGNLIDSGEGNDTILSGDGDDAIVTGPGNDSVNAGDGENDVKTGDGNDRVTTGDGEDLIDTGSGNDEAESGDGEDSIVLGNGNDRAHAGGGNDTIDAGPGNDVVNGGPGFDVCSAGSGTNSVSNCEA